MEDAGSQTTPNVTSMAVKEKRTTTTRTLTGKVRRFMTKPIWSEKDGRNRDHIPPMPVWAAGLRIAQFALAIATLALTTYGIATIQRASGYRRITNWSGTEGYPYSWFLFSWTCVYLTWLCLAVTLIPIMYNCWVHLGIEILTLLLWLIAMALLASHSDELDSIDAYVDGLGPAFEAHYKNSIEEYAKGFVVATFAATAVASFNLVLFVVTLVFFGRALHAHRMSGMTTTRSRRVQGLSDPDKIAAAPWTFGNEAPHPPWVAAHRVQFPLNPLHHSRNGQPPRPDVPHGANGSQPPPCMSSHFMSHPNRQAQDALTSMPPPPGIPPPTDHGHHGTPGSPAFGVPGSVLPQHSYAMYDQQVPIAPQHTGESQPGPESPQYPMVMPVGVTKSDLRGVRETPPPLPPQPPPLGRMMNLEAAASYPGQPAELSSNDEVGDGNMPAELPHDPVPRPSSPER